MDYEKKHKEEIDRATQLWECGDITRENLEYIFPELQESEDEKIRKELYDFCIKCSHGDTVVNQKADYQRWATWLEKQKPVEWSNWDEDILFNIQQDYQDKLNGNSHESNEQYYLNVINWLKSLKSQPKQEWSEEDETLLEQIIMAWEGLREQEIDKGCNELAKEFYNKALLWLKSLKPQRMVSAEAKEALYDKPVEHIVDEGKEEIDYCFTKMMLGEKINDTDEDKVVCVNEKGIVPKKEPEGALKQLLDEYSVDDLEMENLMMAVDDFLEEHPEYVEKFKKKHIELFGNKPQIRWKPSDEQIESLCRAINVLIDINEHSDAKILTSLYNDIKKLREE